MKYIKILAIGALASSMFVNTSCSDILKETPRGSFTPTFFETEDGVKGAVTSMYAHLRFFYGNGYYYNSVECGTDEYTWGAKADGNFKNGDLSGVGTLDPTSGRADVLWAQAWPNINTAFGVIENAEKVGVAADVVAEVRFFVAFDYFLLVQTFGGVPLDLGAGELKFNTKPIRTSVRNTVPEVYTKAVFPYLKQAINDLPEKPRLTGTVTKTVARLFLTKAYLAYAWWLQNPNEIPTYPETARTDPDGHDAAWYFQQAYDVALAGINGAADGGYALQPTYYDVNVGGNERNSEWLLWADHTENSAEYNGSAVTGYGGGSSPGNFVHWMVAPQYDVNTFDGIKAVSRSDQQYAGRPWTRMAPTIGVFTKTFADKTKDSRFDGTFAASYLGNWDKAGIAKEYITGANGMKIYPGEPVYSFIDDPNNLINYSTMYGGVGAGTLPGRADYVIGLNVSGSRMYPGLWKLGNYRTNTTGLGEFNIESPRPFPVAKFSEFYLAAAEAAVKGATTTSGNSARELINVLRARAGKWRWMNNANKPLTADYSADLVAATPAVIDINYILDERSRELFGEGYRWFDLVRTQKWNEYADEFQIARQADNVGASGNEFHTVTTVKREIKKTNYLQPIPQGQIDGMEGDNDFKKAYQNPGYN